MNRCSLGVGPEFSKNNAKNNTHLTSHPRALKDSATWLEHRKEDCEYFFLFLSHFMCFLSTTPEAVIVRAIVTCGYYSAATILFEVFSLRCLSQSA